jgi:hypothetical protein
MKKITKIPTLSSYNDWLEKAEHDLSMFEKTHNVYDMANCFLSLNSLREWISKDDTAPENLKKLSLKIQEAISKMKGNLNLEKLKNNDIDQSINLIRMFCNHAKHSCNHAKHRQKKDNFVEIEMGAKLPTTFPTKFEYLRINESCSIKSVDLLKNVIKFWKKNI